MKIGELARRAGATTRQLRYYEEQGLIEPERTESNYREYGEDAVEKARQIRGLIESGMPTRVIRMLLPCLAGPDAQMPHHENPEMASMLEAERARLQDQIRMLTRSQEQVECYLERVKEAGAVSPAQT